MPSVPLICAGTGGGPSRPTLQVRPPARKGCISASTCMFSARVGCSFGVPCHRSGGHVSHPLHTAHKTDRSLFILICARCFAAGMWTQRRRPSQHAPTKACPSRTASSRALVDRRLTSRQCASNRAPPPPCTRILRGVLL